MNPIFLILLYRQAPLHTPATKPSPQCKVWPDVYLPHWRQRGPCKIATESRIEPLRAIKQSVYRIRKWRDEGNPPFPSPALHTNTIPSCHVIITPGWPCVESDMLLWGMSHSASQTNTAALQVTHAAQRSAAVTQLAWEYCCWWTFLFDFPRTEVCTAPLSGCAITLLLLHYHLHL